MVKPVSCMYSVHLHTTTIYTFCDSQDVRDFAGIETKDEKLPAQPGKRCPGQSKVSQQLDVKGDHECQKLQAFI